MNYLNEKATNLALITEPIAFVFYAVNVFLNGKV